MPDDSTIEPELSSLPPRQVELRQGKSSGSDQKFLSGCLLGMITLCFLPAIVPLLLMQHDNLELMLAGKTTPGVVSRKEINQDDNVINYEIWFNYSVGGQSYSSVTDTDATTYKQIEPGSHFPVTYAPSNAGKASLLLLPGHSVLQKALTPELLTAGGLFLIYLLVLAGTNMGIQSGVKAIRTREEQAKWLLVYGQVGRARVTEKSVGSDEGAITYIIGYEFSPREDDLGKQIQRHLLIPEMDWRDLNVGDRLSVLYNPGNPQSHQLYRFSDYKIIA